MVFEFRRNCSVSWESRGENIAATDFLSYLLMLKPTMMATLKILVLSSILLVIVLELTVSNIIIIIVSVPYSYFLFGGRSVIWLEARTPALNILNGSCIVRTRRWNGWVLWRIAFWYRNWNLAELLLNSCCQLILLAHIVSCVHTIIIIWLYNPQSCYI